MKMWEVWDMEIGGIAISQVRLILSNIWFTVLALVLMVVVIGFAFISHSRDVRRTKNRISELSARPNQDPSTHRRIAKLQRRLAREKKERCQDWWIYAISVPLIALMLVFFVIPGWTDYACKDYVVYEGTFTVKRSLRHSYVFLEDGTQLRGAIGLEEGTHEGQVVYTKRTKITLGGET